MLGVHSFLLLHLGTQVLRLLHEVGIVLVQSVEQIPVRGERLERSGAEQQVEQGAVTGTVHAAGASAKMTLQVGDLGVGLLDTRLGGIAIMFGLLLL